MKYDNELIISSIDIAKEATLLLSLAIQPEDIYDKIEEANTMFTNKHIQDLSVTTLEMIHHDIVMQIIISKIIYISVVVRNLSYHIHKISKSLNSEQINMKSKKELLDFCSKVIHLTELKTESKNFVIKIENAQMEYKYNIFKFCSDVVSFSSFAENYLYDNK